MKPCTVCKTTGEVRAGHPDAIPVNGYPVPPSKFPDSGAPTRRGGMSGEIVAESGRSICGRCNGTGVRH